jgi:hypothetical protein
MIAEAVGANKRWAYQRMRQSGRNLLRYDFDEGSIFGKLARISYSEAYPALQILPRSRNWWARLKGAAPECVHLDEDISWIAAVLPDTLYLRGKRANRRDAVRPEVSVCFECLSETFAAELESFPGRVVAFEPDPAVFTQYFFVATTDFEAAGLTPETSAAINTRLERSGEACCECSRGARWLWFSQEQIQSLDEVELISSAPGEVFCGKHGARKLLSAFEKLAEANIFYMNLPYGDAGTYVWI